MQDWLLVNEHDLDNYPEVDVNTIANGKLEASSCLAIKLALVVKLIDLVKNHFIDILMSGLIKDLVKAVDSRMTKTSVELPQLSLNKAICRDLLFVKQHPRVTLFTDDWVPFTVVD